MEALDGDGVVATGVCGSLQDVEDLRTAGRVLGGSTGHTLVLRAVPSEEVVSVFSSLGESR
jgi:hypothetical protein